MSVCVADVPFEIPALRVNLCNIIKTDTDVRLTFFEQAPGSGTMFARQSVVLNHSDAKILSDYIKQFFPAEKHPGDTP